MTPKMVENKQIPYFVPLILFEQSWLLPVLPLMLAF
jgi:hypothetical protein